MFEKIEEVPAAIAEFYTVETRSEPTGEMQPVEYPSFDEEGNPTTITRMEPVYLPVDYVVQVPVLERKSLDDVWRIVAKHRGQRDGLVRQFLSMVCCANQWKFHDEYLAWYQEGQELDAVVLPESTEENPDPLAEHTAKLEAHAAEEPVKPILIDIDQWMLDNYSQLREAAYETPEHQDEMRFDDAVNGTTVWVDHIKSVKAQYPKPEA